MQFEYQDLVNKIEHWAVDRNLIEGSDSFRQYNKLEEEADELLVGLMAKDMDEVSDAIGDMFVVLTIIAKQNGLMIGNCIEGAYNEIKDRKGKMVNGIFVKEAA